MIQAMLSGLAKTTTAALLGWLPAALMMLLLSGCVKWEKDPLAAYTADPKAFNFWLVYF